MPPYIVSQLEKANDVIRRQSAELDRLRSSDLSNENLALRNRLVSITQQYRSSREHILEQEALLSELNHEVKSLTRDKEILQDRCIELDRKYKKAKACNKDLEAIMEMVEPSTSKGHDANSLLDKSRRKHTYPKNCQCDQFESLQMCLENAQVEIEDLRCRLEKEVNLAQSLHEDLDQSRKLVLERDEQINELTSKLRTAELNSQQTEEHLSRTSTDLALERARCDELTLSLHESENLLSQIRGENLSLGLEIERLMEEARLANQQIVSYRAKLDAQGADLIATKKALRVLQRDKPAMVTLNDICRNMNRLE